MGRVSQ